MATREELFKLTGIWTDGPNLVKKTKKAYESLERQVWEEGLEKAPHGQPWFTSFHASGFPSEKPCARLALYTMMDLPQPEPMSSFLRGVADIGKAVEYQIVYRWGRAGITIGGSVPLWDGAPMKQVGFEDESTWLTGSSDAVLDMRPEYDAVLPVDVKSKDNEVIRQMQVGLRSYDEKHYYQVQGYIYLCRLFHEEMGWNELGLQPARGASIFYACRQDPTQTAEFYVDANWDLIDKGVELLKEWQTFYVDGILPERDKSWKWTEKPCQWCPMKKHVCKPDYKDKVTELHNSNGLKFAQSLSSMYNFNQKKEEVLERWTKEKT